MGRLALIVGLLAGCDTTALAPDRVLNEDLAAGPEPILPPPEVEVRCERTDNVLRGICTVTLLEAAPVELHLAPEGGEIRTFHSDDVALVHRFDLYFLTQDTTWAWDVQVLGPAPPEPVRGTFRTLHLPPGADMVFGVNEGESGTPMIGLASPCPDDYTVIVDPHTNQVLWYEQLGPEYIGLVEAVAFTEDRTVLAIVQSSIVEVDLMGRRLLEVPRDVFPNRLHHDLFRKNGLTYVLFQEIVTLGSSAYLLDGFYVLDPAGKIVGEWHLADHFIPREEGDDLFAEDYSHANAIWVDDAQQVLLSFRHLSAIAMVDGALGSPTFGEITWRLSPPGSEFGSDFALTSVAGPPDDFERQHNAHLADDGSLVLFDNRLGFDEVSRVLVVSLDPVGQQAVIKRQFPLPKHCDYQGAGLNTVGGGLLATCAPSREAWEFDELTGLERWHGVASCAIGFGTYIPRFVPLDW